MLRKLRIPLLLVTALLTMAMLACGGDQEEPEGEAETSQQQTDERSPVEARPGSKTEALGATQIGDSDTMLVASGLKYIDVKEGTGASPERGDVVQVHYTGWLLDGTKFDSSRDRGQPLVFPQGMGRMIPGFDQGVSTMQVGGVRKMILPPELAYGAAGRPPRIPPSSTLVFEVELLGIQEQQQQQPQGGGGN